jgi:hypothetical protein
VNLKHRINSQFALDLSSGQNKCFAVVVQPHAGGRTKTFVAFADAIFQEMLTSGILSQCLASLRAQALVELGAAHSRLMEDLSDTDAVAALSDSNWFLKNGIDFTEVEKKVLSNTYLQQLSPEFPLMSGANSLIPQLVDERNLADFYMQLRPGERLKFLFNDLVCLYLAAGFNGGYIFVDDFERVPDFQSARQKKDFALELRSCLYDGMYQSARTGFYVCFLVLHAGVAPVIREAWETSGLMQRAPLPDQEASHIVNFRKLETEDTRKLLQSYIREYRTEPNSAPDEIYPFSEDAIQEIGRFTELNAARILKLAYESLRRAAENPGVRIINKSFVEELTKQPGFEEDHLRRSGVLDLNDPVNLREKLGEDAE